jgi:predicted GNAT family acetyltransferase
MTLETADKTGAPTTVAREPGRFTIAVDGRRVGMAEFSDRAGRRSFFHTEVDDAFQGRGLATILVAHALAATREDGLRIVAPCSMVAAYLEKSGEYDDLVDPL